MNLAFLGHFYNQHFAFLKGFICEKPNLVGCAKLRSSFDKQEGLESLGVRHRASCNLMLGQHNFHESFYSNCRVPHPAVFKVSFFSVNSVLSLCALCVSLALFDFSISIF